MHKCLALIALSYLVSCPCMYAMNDNNAPEQNDTEKRIEAFVKNARVTIENMLPSTKPAQKAADSILVQETDELENIVEHINARRKAIHSAPHLSSFLDRDQEDRANEEAIARIYEEDRITEKAAVDGALSSDSVENVHAILARMKKNTIEANQLLSRIHGEEYHGVSYDHTVPEDYAVAQQSNSNVVASIDNDNNAGHAGNDNNVVASQPAPVTIRNAEELLRTELMLNPKNAFNIFLRYFKAHPASVNERKGDLNNTSLHECAITTVQLFGTREGNVTLLGMVALLSAGADTAAVNNEKVTPFDIILNSGNEMLIQLITTENPTSDTILNLALEHGNQDLVEQLLN